MPLGELDRRPRERLSEPPPPAVVGEYRGIGLTAASAATVLFVPRATGQYRLTMIAQCTTGGDAIVLTSNAIFTDTVGAVTAALPNTRTLLTTGRDRNAYEFEAVAGSSIGFSTTLTGARVASVWNLMVVLERLQ